MISWPEELVEAIARRKCVLFLGSGISANSRNSNGKSPATWEPFLKSILEKFPEKLNTQKEEIELLLSQKDYLMACEIIVNEIGERDFESRLPRSFVGRGIFLQKSIESFFLLTPES